MRPWGGPSASAGPILQEERNQQGEIVREVKEVMAVVTLMQPEAQEANEQYR